VATQSADRLLDVPGVSKFDAKRATLQRRIVLAVTVIPFVGFIGAVYALWGSGLTATAAAIALAFYVWTGLGITVGFHRYFTHQSFETNDFVRGALAIAGSMAVQGPIITWVADHRRHHAYSDREGDPHSPHLDDGPGVRGVVKGLWHAHLGWLFSDERTEAKRWAPDMLKDPLIRRIDRLFPLWVVLTFALPPVIGLAVTGTLHGALLAGLWGSLARVFMLHHVTWSINSICHFYGKRPYESDDFSTNNWVLSLVSFGESWHNNHHAFPSAAVHGIERAQLDPSGAVIRFFGKLGLAKNIKTVTDKQRTAKVGE
jgi:stearoyl-CoA desaturase (delta-9 desaturase)